MKNELHSLKNLAISRQEEYESPLKRNDLTKSFVEYKYTTFILIYQN